jgi:DNA invertase Pin-like site-specific DNA recombinase
MNSASRFALSFYNARANSLLIGGALLPISCLQLKQAMKLRAALYCCDVPDQATAESQEGELRLAARQRDWDVVEVFRDRPAKGNGVRHARDALCRRLKMSPAEFNIVMVWSIHCLASTLKDLVAFVGLLSNFDQQLFLMFQDVDTTDVSGRNWIATIAMLADFDRQKTEARVTSRTALARNRSGKTLNARIDPELRARIERDLSTGEIGQRKIAAKYCVGLGSVKKIRAETAQPPKPRTVVRTEFMPLGGDAIASNEPDPVPARGEIRADSQTVRRQKI